MAPGEPENSIPILKCGICPEYRTGFRTVAVGKYVIDFRDGKRFAEDARRHDRARIPDRGTQRAHLIVKHRHPPVVAGLEIGVIPVLMIVNPVEGVANCGEYGILLEIYVGDQTFVAELIFDICGQFAEDAAIQTGEKTVPVCRGVRKIFLCEKLFALRKVEIFRQIQCMCFVEQRDAEESGIRSPGHAGVGIAVRQ